MATPADDEMREAIAHAAGIAILAIGPSAVKRKDSGGGRGTGGPAGCGLRSRQARRRAGASQDLGMNQIIIIGFGWEEDTFLPLS